MMCNAGSAPCSASKPGFRIEIERIVTGYSMWGNPKYSSSYKMYDNMTGNIVLSGVNVPNPALLDYLPEIGVEIFIYD